MDIKAAAERIVLAAKEAFVRFPSIWDETKIKQTCGAAAMSYRAGDSIDEAAALANLIDRYGVSEKKEQPKDVSPTTSESKAEADFQDDAVSKVVSKSVSKSSSAAKRKPKKKKLDSDDEEDDESEFEAEISEDSDAPASKKRKEKPAKERAPKKSKILEAPDQSKPATDQKGQKKTEIIAVESNRQFAEAIMEMASLYFKSGDPRKGGVFSKAAKAIREADFAITSAKQAMTLKGIGKGIATYIEEKITTGQIVRLEELRAGL